MTNLTNELIQKNYSVESMKDRVDHALEKAGLGNGILKWDDLVSFDQFHVRGLAATQEMADALELKPGEQLLDSGSGLGGPARYLAAKHQVQGTGVDLTHDLVEI